MAGRLKHWQYDSFVTDFDDPAIEPAYVTFALDSDGTLTLVMLNPVSKIAAFTWDYQDLDLKPVDVGHCGRLCLRPPLLRSSPSTPVRLSPPPRHPRRTLHVI